MGNGFSDKRVFITSSQTYMDPVIKKLFQEHGAEVITDYSHYAGNVNAPSDLIRRAGKIDILIVNLLPEASDRYTGLRAAAD